MKNVWTKFLRASGAFRVACAGNVAITFAFATLPVIGITGYAVDYSHANSVKAAMQAALDSTALMLAKDAATLSSDDLQTKARNYFTALFTKPEAASVSVSAVYSATGGSNVVVNGSATVPTSFLRALDVIIPNAKLDNITVSGSSTAKWGTTRLRVALALDNTGSMADDGKITALISATKSLLTQLKNAASTDGDVYVSIVPFSRDVAVDGASNYSGNWIDWTDWAAAPANSMPNMSVGPGDNCPWSNNQDGYRCTTGPVNGSSNTNSIPNSGTYKGYICPSVDSGSGSYYNGCYNSTKYSSTGSSASCSGHSHCSCSGSGSSKTCTTDNGYYEHAWVANATSTWNGCITDRGNTSTPNSANYDQNVTAPVSGTAASYYPAEQYTMCSQPMMGLSYDWTSMNSLVDAMTPNGNTNQPIGLVWGWQSLVGGGPLSAPAMQTGYTYQQIIILLSDGLNTQDRWYTSQNSIDKRMYDSSNSGAGTCANIKAAGTTIYSIQVNTGGDPQSTLMQNCASDANKFWMLTSASQIMNVFTTIGTNLTQLRVAR